MQETMNSVNKISERILAIYPTTKGFAYLITEGSAKAIYWANIYSKDKNKLLHRFKSLLEIWEVDRIVTESFDKKSRRKDRARILIKKFKEIIREKKIKTSSYPKEKVSLAFESFGAKTKYTRAKLVTDIFDELSPVLPRKRKIWEAEHINMYIFDCAVLIMTHFYHKI